MNYDFAVTIISLKKLFPTLPWISYKRQVRPPTAAPSLPTQVDLDREFYRWINFFSRDKLTKIRGFLSQNKLMFSSGGRVEKAGQPYDFSPHQYENIAHSFTSSFIHSLMKVLPPKKIPNMVIFSLLAPPQREKLNFVLIVLES